MKRWMFAALCVPLVLTLLAAARRPSIGGQEAELKRVTDAICAKADADGDAYRPFVCAPRCDCLSQAFIQNATSCEVTGPGSFEIESLAAAGQCTQAGACAGSSLQLCSIGQQFCFTPGEVCDINCTFGICVGQCKRSCTSNADCPDSIGSATLSGVGAADSPQVVVCETGAGPRGINSNDALSCLTQVQAVTGPCQ